MEEPVPTLKRLLLPKFLLDLLFPPSCLECGKQTVERPGLCSSCWPQINFIEKPVCDQLGVPFAFEPGEGILSAEALARPPKYSRARYVAHYDGVARSLVHKIKYRDQTHLARFMAELMVKMGEDILCECDLIVPVPLHYRRLFFRRFNQASLLADHVSNISALPTSHLVLVRSISTRSQIGLTKKERQKNVARAFTIDKKRRDEVRGKRVLLIDDVVTTGSTIEACTKVLLRAGASDVNILGFSRVVDSVRTL